MENKTNAKTVNEVAETLGKIAGWFLSSAFILWGWSVAAPHLNAPLFTYWEIFAMRMALSSLTNILRSSGRKG